MEREELEVTELAFYQDLCCDDLPCGL